MEIGKSPRAIAARSALLVLLSVSSAYAQTASPPTELAPVEVHAQRVDSDWLEAGTAITSVDAADLTADRALSLAESLQRVPGVFVQNQYNFSQGLRLSIRGFGARASFGVRGIRVLVDGVPLTLPDGQTELDGFDLSLVDRVEVIRGPASTLYGNAAGGVLALTTREPPPDFGASLDLSGGELGYRGQRASAGGTAGHWSGLGAYSRLRSDGPRAQGRGESDAFSGKLRYQGAAGNLRLILNAIDNESLDPGGLNAGEVQADRSQAAPNNLLYDAGETIRQQRVSAAWDAPLSELAGYRLWLYAGQREFANRLPFSGGGQSAFDRDFGGAGAQYTRRSQLFGLAQQWSVGLDLEAQRDDRHRYDNGEGGLRGAETLHQREKADGAGLFGEGEVELGGGFSASAGVRYDRLKLAVDDRFESDGDDGGSRTLHEWSLSGGLEYAIASQHRLYLRLSDSFESPTINELANPDGGGFNRDLEAAHALNRELGFKGRGGAFRYELALYNIELDDELLSYEIEGQSGRTYYRNAGRSSRDGVEASLDWRLSSAWQLSLAYTWSRNRFDEYTLDGVDYAGNTVPGLPRHQGFAELAWALGIWSARVNVVAYDHYEADDANTQRANGVALSNLRVAASLPLSHLRIEPYAGIDNLFDREYYDNLRINASFGRYYEPGPGRTVYAGIKLIY